MFRVSSFGGMFSTGGVSSRKTLPFSYRINSQGAYAGEYSDEGMTYLCSWHRDMYYEPGVQGFPVSDIDPSQMKSCDLAAFLASPTSTPDWVITNSDVGTGTWNLGSDWDRLEANSSAGYGILQSFSAWGSVGIVYLVDLIAVLDLVNCGATTPGAFLPQSLVSALYARPRVRGCKTLYAGFSYGTWGSTAQGLTTPGNQTPLNYRTANAGRGRDGSGDITHTYPNGEVLKYGSVPYECWVTVPEGATNEGPTSDLGYAHPRQVSGTYPVEDSHQRGGPSEIVHVQPTVGGVGFSYLMYLYDILAVAEVKAAHIPTTVGIPSGDLIKVPSRANLGIMYRPITTTTNVYPVQGSVNLLI